MSLNANIQLICSTTDVYSDYITAMFDCVLLLYRSTEEDEGIHTMESEEDEFAAVQRNSEILKSVSSRPPIKHDTFTQCWTNVGPTS